MAMQGEKELREKMQQGVMVLRNHTAMRAWRSWQDFVVMRQEAQERAGHALSLMLHQSQARAFQAWKVCTLVDSTHVLFPSFFSAMVLFLFIGTTLKGWTCEVIFSGGSHCNKLLLQPRRPFCVRCIFRPCVPYVFLKDLQSIQMQEQILALVSMMGLSYPGTMRHCRNHRLGTSSRQACQHRRLGEGGGGGSLPFSTLTFAQPACTECTNSLHICFDDR